MTGVVGLGGMGSGIASSLVRAGHEVLAYDIDSARMTAVVAAGAQAGTGVPQLCEQCDVVVLSLPTSHVAVRVMETELVPHAREGLTVVDMGTTLVEETRRLASVFRERGASLLDAPVSGGTKGAEEGALLIFVGGSKPDVERVGPVLNALGTRVTYCGESGAGQVTKAVNQLCMGLVDAAFLEATAFGVNGGVEPSVLVEAIGGTDGFRAQFARIASRVARGEGDGFDVKYAELDYFLEFARSRSMPSPMLEALSSFMKQFPARARDNMNRPYPPLWSALVPGGANRD